MYIHTPLHIVVIVVASTSVLLSRGGAHLLDILLCPLENQLLPHRVWKMIK